MSQPVSATALVAPLHPHFMQEIERITLPIKTRSHELMQIQGGDRLLDVGCGPASDTIALADRTGRNGFVIGVDFDKETIAEAERRAIAAGVGDRVRHRTVSAMRLPFKDAEFDSCRSERTFQHLEDPQAALSEMVRVTKPGGYVVVAELDWGAGSIDTPHPHTEHELQHVLAQHVLTNGYSGRMLYRLFRQAGLQDVEVELMPIVLNSLATIRFVTQMDTAEAVAIERGILTPEEIAAWRADLEEYDAAGVLFSHTSMVLAVGRVAE